MSHYSFRNIDKGKNVSNVFHQKFWDDILNVIRACIWNLKVKKLKESVGNR